MHFIVIITICYIIGIILSQLIWKFTFGKQWLIREFGQDFLIWIGLLWPISLLTYTLIMSAAVILKIILVCKKKRL